MTTYFLNYAANKLYRDASYPLYLGLSSTAPSDNGTGVTEPSVSGGGYARVLITDLGASVDGVVTNTKRIDFPRLLKPDTTVTHWVVYTSATAGDLVTYGKFDEAIPIISNTIVSLEPGKLKLTVRNPKSDAEA